MLTLDDGFEDGFEFVAIVVNVVGEWHEPVIYYGIEQSRESHFDQTLIKSFNLNL